MQITMRKAECHDQCLDVKSENHWVNINRVGGTTKWRADCESCCTCIRVRPTKQEAVDAAIAHIREQ